MDLFVLLVLSSISVISAVDSQIDRQNNDNYDSLNRYKPTDTSSYGTSGGYYPRNAYEQYNQNRFNVDLSGKEFRPPNVFAVGLIPTPTPYMSPLMAQPRQYQISMAGGPSGLMPYQVNGAPLLQSAGYSMAGGLANQYSGLGPYGVPTRIGIGDTLSSAAQGYGYGSMMSDPYYGGRYGMGSTPYSPYSYGAPGYMSQAPGYHQTMSYANPASSYLNRGYAYGFGPQYASQSYQISPMAGQSYTNGYNNYNNNYNNNNYENNGITQEVRDDKNYASSASTNAETHSSPQSSESPAFEANRLGKRFSSDSRRVLNDHRTM